MINFPKVAGVAGLVISANPSLDATEVLKILARTASTNLNSIEYAFSPPLDSGEFRYDEFSLREDKLWSPWYGNGKVDARAAVVAALNLREKLDSNKETYTLASKDTHISTKQPEKYR